MYNDTDREKSCGAVIWKNTPLGHEYLLIQHRRHWSFPKGHVEGAETEKATALREVKEETGLDVALDSRFRKMVSYRTQKGNMKDVVFFIATPIGGVETPQLDEINDLRWFSFKKALPRVTFETDNAVLCAAENYIHSHRRKFIFCESDEQKR